MKKQLIDQLLALSGERYDADVLNRFHQRAVKGKLTRDENPRTHFCVYFAQYDPQSQEIFMGHHKKSGLWLVNGGHIDEGELLEEAVVRELGEELGVQKKAADIGEPDLLTITPIENERQVCKTHFDIWYFFPVDKAHFSFDQDKYGKEFHESAWLTYGKARQRNTDPATKLALDYLTQSKNLV